MQTPPPKSSIVVSEVVVVSPAEVIVDGVSVGRLCDAIANMPQHAHKFQVALEKAWAAVLDSEISKIIDRVP